MKKSINYFKVLMIFCLLCSVKVSLGQAPCSATVGGYVSNAGNASFYVSAAATSSNTNSMFSWNFGNGAVASGINMLNAATIYTANGTYVATVTYTSASVGCTATATTTVVVTNANGCGLVPQFYSSIGANGLVNFNGFAQNSLPGASYTWRFGDGSPNGTGATIAHTYAITGASYQVTLTVNNNSTPACVDSIVGTVAACGGPATITSTSNLNGSVTFSATTSAGTGTTANCYWTFGDGSSGGSPGLSTSHTYLANGNYTVTFMGGIGQCTSTVQYPHNVSNVTAPCGLAGGYYAMHSSNGLVNFTNQSTGTSGGVTYAWTFGDGGTSSATSPAHTYSANGTYIVTFLANNNYSYTCQSSSTMAIIVGSYCNIAAGFNASIGANGSVSFANTSSGTTTGSLVSAWNFGDGVTSNLNSPAHTYANGTYTVTLTASRINSLTPGCTNSISQVITVTTCVADASFSMSPTGTPQFWNAYPLVPGNISSATWDWGDNSSSNTLYTAHTYSAAGSYDICLTVTVTCGSVNSYCMPYSIYRSSGVNEDNEIIQVTVVDPVTVGIKNTRSEKIDYTISPNPNNGLFKLTIKELTTGNTKISVYNIVGKLVYQTDVDAGNSGTVKEIQLDQVPEGVYFVKVNANNKVFTQKLIINKQ